MVFDYLDGGAEDEIGLRRNQDVFARTRLIPRRLVDVSQREQTTSLLGEAIAAPMVIAPTGLNGVLWPKGDIALARAAAKAGLPFTLSTASNATLEDVAGQSDGDLWFQLYVVQRRLATRLTERALEAGYRTLILTTDVPVNGLRERDLRNGFSLPMRYTPRTLLDGMTHPRWALQFLRNGMPQMRNLMSATANDVDAQAALLKREMDATFSWDDLRALRDAWPHRLLVKGILHPEDAARCMEIGADGVILSNHGGRQLDAAPTALEMLPRVREAVNGTVLIDGGIRRGADVVKAVAMGADAVMLGRATLYGLAVAGETGVSHVIDLLKADIDRTLALIGCPAVSALNCDFVMEAGETLAE